MVLMNGTEVTRDADVQRVFEIADDSLQGIIGYHMYVAAIQQAVDREKIHERLPKDSFQITWDWVRFYQREDLVRVFRTAAFELFESRILLIAMTNVFEATLGDFIDLLHRKGFCQYASAKERKRMGYKQYVEWICRLLKRVQRGDYGNKQAIERLAQTLGIIDNARRLRNRVVHNRALFDESYEEDAIRLDGIAVDLHPDWKKFKANPGSQIPVIIDWRYLKRLLITHIEVLHVLHNCIQREYFGVSQGYNYKREQKPIDWERMLWATARVHLG